MEPRNPAAFKARVQSSELLLGNWISLPYPMNVEILSRSQADFLLLDGEHSAILASVLPDLLPGAELGEMPVVFRVRSSGEGEIKTALDAGVSNIMVPKIETAEQARSVVSAAKYPPAGCRGIGPWRASNFYEDMEDYLRFSNERSMVIVQIETAAGLKNAAEIADVDGVDILYVGPADLSAALGLPVGEMSNQLLQESAAIASAAKARGKIAGTDVVSLDSLPALRGAGFTFFTYGSDIAFLQTAAASCIADFRRITNAS